MNDHNKPQPAGIPTMLDRMTLLNNQPVVITSGKEKVCGSPFVETGTAYQGRKHPRRWSDNHKQLVLGALGKRTRPGRAHAHVKNEPTRLR